jgi:hypothetical protein
MAALPKDNGDQMYRAQIRGEPPMRDVFPVTYSRDEGFVEYKIEINEEDLQEIIEDSLMRHTAFDFDE